MTKNPVMAKLIGDCLQITIATEQGEVLERCEVQIPAEMTSEQAATDIVEYLTDRYAVGFYPSARGGER